MPKLDDLDTWRAARTADEEAAFASLPEAIATAVRTMKAGGAMATSLRSMAGAAYVATLERQRGFCAGLLHTAWIYMSMRDADRYAIEQYISKTYRQRLLQLEADAEGQPV